MFLNLKFTVYQQYKFNVIVKHPSQGGSDYNLSTNLT